MYTSRPGIMMKYRRKPNSMNALTSSLTESNELASNDTEDSVVNGKALNGSSTFEAYETQRTSKYFLIFISICTIGSMIPLLFHMKYSLEDQKVELNAPKKRRRIKYNNTVVPIEDRFIELANKWKRRTPEIAKSLHIGYKPSENKPFIFFHQRKAGGSTFRQFLYDAANNLGARSWIPSCRFGPIPCAVFALPTHAKFAVYGGHFRYMEAHKNFIVTNFKTFLLNKNKPTPKPFTCLVTARPTIDRVVSCWNYRFIQELKLDPKVYEATTMTPTQWDELLPTAFSRFNEGCNNEFIRNFGDIQDELVINDMKPTGHHQQDLLALRELNNVFERISNCVVTTLPKCDEGLEVIGYFLPWLQRNAQYDCETKVNAIKKDIKKSNQLTPQAEKAILKHNFVDELVYDFIDTLFEEQLKHARKNRKTDTLPLPIKKTPAIREKAKTIVQNAKKPETIKDSASEDKNLPVDEAMNKEMAKLESNIMNSNPKKIDESDDPLKSNDPKIDLQTQ